MPSTYLHVYADTLIGCLLGSVHMETVEARCAATSQVIV